MKARGFQELWPLGRKLKGMLHEVGFARQRGVALLHVVVQELSFAFGDRVHFSCLSKRNRTKEKDTPRSRPLRGFVSRSRGFRQFILELAKTRVRPARAPSGRIVSDSPLPRGPEKRRDVRFFALDCSWVPWERRVAQEFDGERRACSSTWARRKKTKHCFVPTSAVAMDGKGRAFSPKLDA